MDLFGGIFPFPCNARCVHRGTRNVRLLHNRSPLLSASDDQVAEEGDGTGPE